ncbi:hypothetical protein RUM43_000280 [Polyplax serrata]|uniref:Ig-like domain-containing protein n=1 Tax=Polyplax serrata TaxID=468196 RepID=A0AAN8SGR9_POLSC
MGEFKRLSHAGWNKKKNKMVVSRQQKVLCEDLGRSKNHQKLGIPKIEILGESDMYVKSGSTVSLKCVITQSLEEPAYIFWYHDNERVLDYDRRYKDIRVERVGSDTTVGSLILHQATKEDSGNYTCSPSNLDSSSILLHVLNVILGRSFSSSSLSPGFFDILRHYLYSQFTHSPVLEV